MAKSANKIKVGDGATEYLHSDRHAYTVVEVISQRKIIVQQDKAVRTDKNGMSEAQTYTFEADPNGRKATITLRKDGDWQLLGKSYSQVGSYFVVGHRRGYYDFSY